MLIRILISVLLVSLLAVVVPSTSDGSFLYHGFHGSGLRLDGNSVIEQNGILRLTNLTKEAIGHAFFPIPFSFINSSSGNPLSFSTSFVFAIVPQYQDVSAHGLAFVISPSKEIVGAGPSQYLGLFNLTSNGNSSNHIVAVELDTVQTFDYNDINDNHVGIDINSLHSIDSAPVSFVSDSDGGLRNLSLISGEPMKLWVDYDGEAMRLDVTLSPIDVSKPRSPLLSSTANLSSVLLDKMYVGFSASTGAAAGSHYVLGWSFSLNGKAQELDVSKLPSLPNTDEVIEKEPRILTTVLPIAASVVLAVIIVYILIVLFKKKKFSEQQEDWEVEYGPHRFCYKDLHKATKGFRDENLLGAGGFGGVFKGVLPKSNVEVAVKRISEGSRQGMKEFVAEIASMGRVRHRNLVQLLGYGRHHSELLLVYDFMPNGSLDKYLFNRPEVMLNWNQRFTIIKGIAAGLRYLHEEWEQVILHRDIKASNVLLDREFNGKLGDFGLARLHNHGSNPETTHIVGTLGYLAPELARTGKATTNSDVYAFGAFLLEVACGRRPVELKTSGLELILVDWVLDLLKKRSIIEARDRRLGDEFVTEEVELVLKLGLVCSHPMPTARPGMRQIVQFLEREAELPELSEDDFQLFDSIARKINASDECTGSSMCSLSVSDTIFSGEGR
ncbi:L-type lectin-domain containing receptor kinase IV.1-like [Asparagus officinalis]|uniref:L-type lectin-domain containing receptor kinase IV.1-like n=1 Tax=Asparagus officinalis TaxID=4686 RepID=UPI00098E3439|nr:L-type lectin-domain containing receptor kinase IV.1-like [Asparagus officinalis]